MEREDARRWKQIITQDLRLARYCLVMGSGPKEYLRARIAENEAMLCSLAALEVGSTREASVAPQAA